MKILNVKKLAFVFALAACGALFTSCQDIIYSNIRKEVKLKDASIKGDIRSIIRYKDDFYCSNGNIYHKSKNEERVGCWIKNPSPTGHVLKLAADSTYIYALVGISKEDYSEGENLPVRRELWYSDDGSNWKKMTGVYGEGNIPYSSSSKVYLFGTNAIKPENRKAYFILNGGAPGTRAYRLDGVGVEVLEFGKDNASTKPTVDSQSCIYCNGEVRFFKSTGSCTNETNTAAPTIYYYGDGSNLKWGGAQTGSVGAYASVYSLACTADYILVGTTSGISHHPLTNGKPGSSSREFPTNAEATMSAQYTILALLVVKPELNELGTIIYESQNYTGSGSNSAQFDHICMWSYYPSRKEWNRE